MTDCALHNDINTIPYILYVCTIRSVLSPNFPKIQKSNRSIRTTRFASSCPSHNKSGSAERFVQLDSDLCFQPFVRILSGCCSGIVLHHTILPTSHCISSLFHTPTPTPPGLAQVSTTLPTMSSNEKKPLLGNDEQEHHQRLKSYQK